MTHLKNPSENGNKPDQSTENQHEQEKNSQEVELPTPEKKNDDITTSNSQKADKGVERAGKLTTDVNDEETGKNKTTQTGFDVNNIENDQRKDKRGDETEKLERDNTTDPKTKDADWQQDKMNEANNQQGSKVTTEKQTENEKKEHDKEDSRHDKEGSRKDTRNDSILDRPKTETYEKNQSEDIGGKINKENYTHSVEEGKRDEQNRKHQNIKNEQSVKNEQSGKNSREKREFQRQNKEIN